MRAMPASAQASPAAMSTARSALSLSLIHISLQGSPLTYYLSHEARDVTTLPAALLNLGGYDFVTLGNHDFDYGKQTIERYLAALNARCLCANVEGIRGVEKTAVVTMENGLRVGLTGMITPFVTQFESAENMACLLYTSDYAESFLNNGISVQQLAKAMRLGKLGEQIVVKSKYAFSLLHYEGFSIAEKEKYYVLRKARNDEADQHYVSILEEETDGLYMLDILRGGIQNDDPRIPRNVSK